MTTRSEQLQVRLTPRQKKALKQRAASSGRDMSSYVLGRVLPVPEQRFEEILRSLWDEENRRFGLAELHDLLAELTPHGLSEAVARADLSRLSPLTSNYVAAMVEQASSQRGVAPPPWTAQVHPLERPYFATPLSGLRLHLLKASPVPFKRRNLFVDSSVGSRV